MKNLTFGQRLRAARKAAKLSQEVVSKKVGMAQSLISELENDMYPTSGFTTRLAHLYKVNARWLGEGLGPMEISAAEALGDDEVLRLWTSYSNADEATKSLVMYLLRKDDQKKPEWMSPALAAMVETARQITKEQIRTDSA